VPSGVETFGQASGLRSGELEFMGGDGH